MQFNLTPKHTKRFEDLSGQIFGRLKVESFHHKTKKGRVYRTFWNCLCACGTNRIVRADTIKEGAPCVVCWSDAIRTTLLASPTKTCSTCKQILDKSEFNIDRQRVDGLHGRCKSCVIKITTAQKERLKSRPKETLRPPYGEKMSRLQTSKTHRRLFKKRAWS